jgi:hypothetical protein
MWFVSRSPRPRRRRRLLLLMLLLHSRLQPMVCGEAEPFRQRGLTVNCLMSHRFDADRSRSTGRSCRRLSVADHPFRRRRRQ